MSFKDYMTNTFTLEKEFGLREFGKLKRIKTIKTDKTH
jgi:hypothetical protein